jgi:hypothetical protein
MTSLNIQNGASLDWTDELAFFFAQFPGKTERAKHSGMRSTGWFLKMKAKEELKNNSQNWPLKSQVTPHFKAHRPSKGAQSAKARRTKSTKTLSKFWGALANLLVYSYDNNGDLLVGFKTGVFGRKYAYTRSDGTKVFRPNRIGESAVNMAKKLTQGHETKVTRKMAGYFRGIGLNVGIGQTIKIPARPVIGPVYKKYQKDLFPRFVEKFWERLRKYNVKA